MNTQRGIATQLAHAAKNSAMKMGAGLSLIVMAESALAGPVPELNLPLDRGRSCNMIPSLAHEDNIARDPVGCTINFLNYMPTAANTLYGAYAEQQVGNTIALAQGTALGAIALAFEQTDGSCDRGTYDVDCWLPVVNSTVGTAVDLAFWAAFEAPGWILGIGTAIADPYVTLATNTVWNTYGTAYDIADWNNDGTVDGGDAVQFPVYSMLGLPYTQNFVNEACGVNGEPFDTYNCPIRHAAAPTWAALELYAQQFPDSDTDGDGLAEPGDFNGDGTIDARDPLQLPIYSDAGYGYAQQQVDRYCVENYNLTGCAIAHSLAPMYIAMEQHARSVPASDTNGDGATDTGEVAAYWTTNSEAAARAAAAHNTYGDLGYGNTQAFVDYNCGVTGESIESQHCLYSQAVAPYMMVAEHAARAMPELDNNGDGFATYDEVSANGDTAVSAQAQMLTLQAADGMEQNGAPLTAQAIREACDQPGAGTAELATSDCTAVIALAPSMFAVERTESQLVDSGICEEGQSTEDCTASQLEPGEPMNFDEHRALFGDGTDAATIPSVLHITGNGAIDALNALAANDAPGAVVSVAVAYQALLDYSLAYGSVYEILSVPAQVIQDTLAP